jgi:beta-galactosidase GanA
MLILSLFLLQIALLCQGSLVARNSTGLTDAVTWDPHSLSILGQRVFILSAEVHPWRIPGNPIFWRDIFEKIKANGFNTVSFYVNWATHYPTPDTNNGEGDFEENTYRDIQLFIDMAKEAGLWLIARYLLTAPDVPGNISQLTPAILPDLGHTSVSKNRPLTIGIRRVDRRF